MFEEHNRLFLWWYKLLLIFKKFDFFCCVYDSLFNFVFVLKIKKYWRCMCALIWKGLNFTGRRTKIIPQFFQRFDFYQFHSFFLFMWVILFSSYMVCNGWYFYLRASMFLFSRLMKSSRRRRWKNFWSTRTKIIFKRFDFY